MSVSIEEGVKSFKQGIKEYVAEHNKPLNGNGEFHYAFLKILKIAKKQGDFHIKEKDLAKLGFTVETVQDCSDTVCSRFIFKKDNILVTVSLHFYYRARDFYAMSLCDNDGLEICEVC